MTKSSRSKTAYRLTRVEEEVAEVRSKVESGQGAMLQAVANLQSQLLQFQITLREDLGRNFVSMPDHEAIRADFRERVGENTRRLDRFDSIYIKALDDARIASETKRREDSDRGLRINLALLASAISLLTAIGQHFIKLPA